MTTPGRRGRSRRALRAAAVAAVTMALLIAEPVWPAGEGPLGLLEALAARLRSEAAWSAAYHQEFIPAGMTLGEEVDGTVHVAWPDRALFSSGEPVIRLMGLEHRLLRLVDLDLPSCESHALSDEEWARIPLAAVLDPQAAVDHFTVLDAGERGFALVPREPGGVARVEVSLDEQRLPRQVVVIDPQGATNRLDFSGWRPADPPEGGWLPPAPPGVDCIGDATPEAPSAGDERVRMRR